MLDEIKIQRISPCVADPRKIRFQATLNKDISKLLPYLNSALKGAIYNHQRKSLTIRKGGKIITLFPRRVVGAKIKDQEDAQKMLRWVKKKINCCQERKGEIEPNYERQDKLSAMDVYKLLPATNCRMCGEETCMAFAMKLVNEETNLMQCGQIFQAEYQKNRTGLIKLLQARGYPVPIAFSEEPN